jgi:integrase
MANVNSGVIPAERIVTVADFAERVYLPWSEQHKRPSTAKSYRDIWEDHLKPLCGPRWLKDTRTYHVQGWLDQIGKGGLSRNTLKHVKSVISGVFTLAKQQNYFDGINPAQNTAINPNATEPEETYAYSLEEIQSILVLLPEPAATAFAVAAFMGLRHGEIQGLVWENYRDGEIFVSRSIWNGRITEPKTRSGRAPVPVIRPLAERLEMHRMRSGNPMSGPMFPNAAGRPRALSSVVNRVILPALNRCEACGKAESNHNKADHPYKRDNSLPEWHGWHAARRGLGSNLYRLGVPEKVIQRILRHANVSTTATYYIKTAGDDVRTAMTKLENHIAEAGSAQSDTDGTPSGNFPVEPSTVQ